MVDPSVASVLCGYPATRGAVSGVKPACRASALRRRGPAFRSPAFARHGAPDSGADFMKLIRIKNLGSVSNRRSKDAACPGESALGRGHDAPIKCNILHFMKFTA